ncbi:germination protein YpeB [Niallia circulans]|jgi:spore germination protein|uniref:Sporulation protein n=1 Tax=Niallia circulans TaxID=1397 RepID=A0A0J1LFI3_NIACI|nr:germination protein YpeB [Niallia circulans]KLV27795.1 sporulation protein [Niallia circulans]MCM2980981.1 germination protein YpeB [Niallia circulans]MDR4314589.1 germination protein YpeB [Niallia circulans]MED3840797.1 germination protein YpeB [Niallia circulans]MED4242751.1 germination protein YpeB [Niallia circulans]
MLRGILIGVLTLGVAGVAFWGYQEHKEKNAVLLNAENNYQRAFHDLTYQVDLLHDQIGTTLAMNSQQSLSPALAEVWRITSEAHSDVGQLPLTLLPFNKTEEFLAKIGDFSYRTAVRDLNKEPLSEEESKTLTKLYKDAADIQDELRNVQHLVLEKNLRWMDVEMALATDKQLDNTIIDGLKTVEDKVEGYQETSFGVTNVNMEKKDENFKNLKGKIITEKEAKEIAKEFADFKNPVDVKVTESGKGSNYGFYSVSLKEKGTNVEASMDITKKGGYPIWSIVSREVKKDKISLNEASNQAVKFLKEHKFKNLALFESMQYENIGVFNFVTEIDGVKIYPDSVKMKVALDNGNIIGFAAEDYLIANKEREIKDPVISKQDARKKINKQVKIMDDGLAIILNDLNKEVLCYEFIGTLGEDTYRIYINADNGVEEKVEKLKNAEPVYEEVV